MEKSLKSKALKRVFLSKKHGDQQFFAIYNPDAISVDLRLKEHLAVIYIQAREQLKERIHQLQKVNQQFYLCFKFIDNISDCTLFR